MIEKGERWSIALIQKRLSEENGENTTSLDDRDYLGDTALIVAIKSDEYAIAQDLILKGVNVEKTDDIGWTALFYAIERRSTQTVELLLEQGANIEAKDFDGWSPLYLAAESENPVLTRMLTQKGANLNTLFLKQRNLSSLLAKNEFLNHYLEQCLDQLTEENQKKWKACRLQLLLQPASCNDE